VATCAVVYAVLLSLSFEVARLFRAYDYFSFVRVLLGRGWPLYEIAILLGMIIALSITVTVGGAVLEEHFSIAAWLGASLIFLLIVVLLFFGRRVVEESMMIGIAALFIVLGVLVVQLVANHGAQVAAAFAEFPHQDGGIATGLKYATVNAGYLPLLLYGAVALRNRFETFAAGIASAILAIVPMVVFHFAFMAGFPAVIDERVPAYWMFGQFSTPVMLNVYVIVMFVLISLTGVGLLQGLIERVDNWYGERYGRPLSRFGHSLIAAAMVIISLLLGTMGIVALILRGYTIMFVTFIVVFMIPLLSYGVYLVYRGDPGKDSV
jgi:uncharacterized membrane protein YkvI